MDSSIRCACVPLASRTEAETTLSRFQNRKSNSEHSMPVKLIAWDCIPARRQSPELRPQELRRRRSKSPISNGLRTARSTRRHRSRPIQRRREVPIRRFRPKSVLINRQWQRARSAVSRLRMSETRVTESPESAPVTSCLSPIPRSVSNHWFESRRFARTSRLLKFSSNSAPVHRRRSSRRLNESEGSIWKERAEFALPHEPAFLWRT